MALSRCARRFVAVLFFAASVAPLCAIAASPDAAESNEEAANLVRSALQFEIRGDAEYRRVMQDLAISRFGDYAPARWQAGYVRDGDAWRTPSEVAALRARDERLTEYAQQRSEASRLNADDHLKLARWCLRNGLADRARYHAAQVFAARCSAETRYEAAKLLSFKVLREEGASSALISEAELKRRVAEVEQEQTSWTEWAPVLERIAEQMIDADENVRRPAIDKLDQIDDPGAIPALELVLSRRSRKHGLAVVRLLSEMPDHEATMSLARHAVFSSSDEVREAAAEQLAKRPIHDYAPWLLSGLVSPIKSRYWIESLPGGGLRYLRDFYREDANHRYTLREDKLFAPGPDIIFMRGFGNPDIREAKIVDGIDPRLTPRAMAQNLAAKAADTQRKVDRQNEQAEAINTRIDRVLELGTDLTMNGDPVRWWEWWQQYNELHTPDKKQLVASYVSTQKIYATPGSGSVTKFIPSCFPAGTLVWTETGARAIETIQGGDRVLAQDVESGELAYKTVIGTTERPPTPLVAIGVGSESIQSTKGHPFWVSGSGWMMAKFLEAGQRLHCADGFRTIDSIEEVDALPAYNLIVEDFATYFVGENRLLVHDNTLRTPTLATVPGLVEPGLVERGLVEPKR